MKPLNLDNKPCSPISSNCVIWQGPDIPCIKLCKGDTVSDIVAKLADELCTILDQLNVDKYDLSCFNLASCGPQDFHELIQLLIDKICEANGITTTEKAESGCPDCVVTVAPCFVQNGQTTMQLLDYVQLIANTVCSIATQISNINTQITDLETAVSNLQFQIDNLPGYTLPNISVDCTLSPIITAPGSYPLDQVLSALVNDDTYGYCALLSSLGLPSDIAAAAASQCIQDTDDSLKFPGQTFAQAYLGSWVPVAGVDTVAEAINNIWIVLCDIYAATSSPVTVSGLDTDTVDITVSAGPNYVVSAELVDTGWVDLLGFDFYSPSVTKPQCRRMGKQIHFRGGVVIPLDNPASPGNVVTFTSTSYNSVMSPTPFTGGPSGVVINPNGSVVFNNGTNIIPASVLPLATNLDSGYGKGNVIASRAIDIDPTYGTALTTVLSVGMTNNKTLFAAVVKDKEITNTRAAGVLGNSPLRFITSNVRAGEFLPNYIDPASDIHNAPANGIFPLRANTFNLTWPFSCDAALETQVGGFSFQLDGLIVYIS